jgi:hypothetical protein
MMEGTKERTVRVRDKTYTVLVHRQSQTVWVASGDCMGQRLELKGTSENSAVAAWSETARYRSG